MKFALNTLKFEDVREQIITMLTEKNEYAAQFDFRSSNIGYYIDTMAYVAMVMNYNLSHIANNKFLDTTEIRKNGVSRAKEIGYTPKRPYSAKFMGKLIYKGTNFTENNSLIIYPRSPFTGSFGNTYTNVEPIVLKYTGNPTQLEGNYTITQGIFKYHKVMTTGQPNASFVLPNTSVDEDNFSLFVIPLSVAENPINGLVTSPYNLENFLQYEWNIVETFKNMVESNVYYMEEDTVNEGFPKIVFGNGIFGAVPPDTSVIYCEYMETLGIAANNENLVSLPPMDKLSTDGQPFAFYGIDNLGTENQNNFSSDNFDVGYTNTYNKSFGGSDIETLDSIKANAPRYYSSVGRAATKSDYVHILNSFAGVGSVNVIGGDELYPDDITKLGNVYACVVPTITTADFLYNNNIYIAHTLETDIRNQLNDYAIISTKRHFYRPSYIVVDVVPHIELNRYMPVAEQTKIKTQVANLIGDYFHARFDTLGVPFRESKISASIDGLNSISSSYLKLNYSFAINNNTVENLIDGVNNVIYLPTKNTKDIDGYVNGTTNFIKTNDQIVKEDMPISKGDWSILDLNYGNLHNSIIDESERMEAYRSKIKLLNSYQSYLKPEDSSIYKELIHPTLSRVLYNRDFADVKVAEFWYVRSLNQFHDVPYGYQDKYKRNIDVSINTVDNYKVLAFTYTDAGETSVTANVAAIFENVDTDGNYTIQMSTESANPSESYEQNLAGYFGVDDTQFIYEGADYTKTPYKIEEISPDHYAVMLRVGSAATELVMTGKNKILDVLRNGSTLNASDPATGWSVDDTVGAFTPLKFNGDVVGHIELSHVGIGIDNASRFKGFVGTQTNQVAFGSIEPANGEVGDYFICTEFIYTPDSVTNKYLYPHDILFIKAGVDGSDNTLEKAIVRKTISSSDSSALNTKNIQGALFVDDIDDTKFYVYNELPEDDNSVVGEPNYNLLTQRTVPVAPSNTDVTGISVDATQSLPLAVHKNQIVQILLDGAYDGGVAGAGIQINYPNTVHDKIGTLKHLTTTGVWENMSTKVKDGDLMIYGTIDAESNWLLLENTNRRTPTDWNAEIQYTVDDLVEFDALVYVCRDTIPMMDPVPLVDDIPTPTPVLTPPDVSPLFWSVFEDRIEVAPLSVGGNGPNIDPLTIMDPTLYTVYKVAADITISSAQEFHMFTPESLPSDNMLTFGNYLVCVEESSIEYPRGLWEIYNGDVYQFQVDAYNGNSSFPMVLNVGDTISVQNSVDPTATMNFNGDTKQDTYITNDLIMYVGGTRWEKITISEITTIFDPSSDAAVGDLIRIRDADGTLGNNIKLDVPRILVDSEPSDMKFDYDDVLYYTGVQWIKAHPVSVYTIPALRTNINIAGFDSDISVVQTNMDEFDIYLLDQFNDATIGRLDYFTGQLTLNTKLTKRLNKLETLPATLSDIFKFENYINSANQMDTIGFKPVRKSATLGADGVRNTDNGADGDFDTNFNQYIVATVNHVELI